eukprot:TRINITY_DN13925_c0_g1_i1.p1 TRINITY_DN13925_c0_g1~~TRINITY_DN13925_c0_g1_i1.p1  ORF type:complete len:890 (+),score=210.52 TRINITY_DN13925_c0_g1_i1:33-2702(+)
MDQWRRFPFFEKELVKEEGSKDPHEYLKKIDVTCASSGRGLLVLGDSEGFINFIDRSYKLSPLTFQAYEEPVAHMQQMKTHNILITVGDDKGMRNMLKIWNLDKTDKSGIPVLVRSQKLKFADRGTITCIAVQDDTSQMAFGLDNGSVHVFQGDLARGKIQKVSQLRSESPHPVTGLGYTSTSRATVLYVTSSDNVTAFHFRNGTGEVMEMPLDDMHGGALGCAALSGDGRSMIVAREDGVWEYQPDLMGGCQGLEHPKTMVACFRSYVAVVLLEEKGDQQTLCLYDPNNKLFAFRAQFEPIQRIICEWGAIFVLTSSRKMFILEEKDAQTKLDMLFRKNLFDVAIRLARSHQYDQALVIDVFRKYGDHLWTKGDYEQAMNKYIMTIGRLEPSYVIRKFLDAQRINNLTSYLQALHEKRLATEDHTTLLLNCYTKLKNVAMLDKFIETGDDLHFEKETAIKVLRQAGYAKHALTLARKHDEHDWVLKILVEDEQEHADALTYIATLGFLEANKNIRKYGRQLMQHMPTQATELLTRLCTDWSVSSPGGAMERAPAEDFIYVFVGQPQWLMVFLERVIQTIAVPTSAMYNTLLELYLDDDMEAQPQAADTPAIYSVAQRRQKALVLLKDKDANYDVDHALVLVQMRAFKPGILFLYEKLKLYHEIVQYYLDNREYANVISKCKEHGSKDPNLWIQVLSAFASTDDCPREMAEVLSYIEQDNLIPPLLVIQILSRNTTTTLNVVRDYVIRKLMAEDDTVQEDEQKIKRDLLENHKMRDEIQELQTSAKTFQSQKCAYCTSMLELPAVHFLCMHSFHQRCLADNEKECRICATHNHKVQDTRRHMELQANQHDRFFKQLEGGQDGFTTVAEYLGRGIFNKLILLDSSASNIV